MADDLRLELRFKNAVLWHAIFDNYGSVAELCRRHDGLNQSGIGKLLSLRVSPISRHQGKRQGNPTKLAMRLSQVLNIDFGILFSPILYMEDVPSLRIVELDTEALRLTAPEVRQLMSGSPEVDLMAKEARARLKEAIAELTEKERQVIVGRFFEEKTQREIAKEMDLSIQRVGQLERHAVWRLRRIDRINRNYGRSCLPHPDEVAARSVSQ